MNMKTLEIIITATRAMNLDTEYPCDIEVKLKCGNHELILKDENEKEYSNITVWLESSEMHIYDREYLMNPAFFYIDKKIEYHEYIEDIKAIELEYLYENEHKCECVQMYITTNKIRDRANDLAGCIDYLVSVNQVSALKEKIKAFNDEMLL